MLSLSYYFQFLTAYFILLTGIQGDLVDPSTLYSGIIDNDIQMVVTGFLVSKLAELGTKVEQHEKEINQLKKENSGLTEKNHHLTLIAGAKEDDETSRASSSSLPRSCFELKATNPSAQSGVYTIDPDGQIGGDPPIKVYCDMTTQTTYIYHDTEAKTAVTSCSDPGCYTKSIAYNATMRQMTKLIDISSSCKQHIRFDSISVPLEYKNEQNGFWNDRNGGKQIFWAGPATSNHTCQCGIENNCVQRNYKCNADVLSPTELFDEGFITATELLPVSKLSFGRTNLSGVKASYTLGRFECTGQAAISSTPSNCLDLFRIGHTLSGFYDVKGSNSHIESTHCDFSKASTEAGYETRYGFVDVKTNPVHFFVTRTSHWNKPGTMQFEKEYLNLGGGMNLGSGVFTAPKGGIYTFTFKGVGNGSASGYGGLGNVRLKRNGATVATSYSSIHGATSATATTLSVNASLKLNKGDKISIFHEDGPIYSGGGNDTYFTGSLVEEDLVFS